MSNHNPIKYLEHLKYKNKAKKIQEAEYLNKNQHIIKREENFHLFFNGANDHRIRNSKKLNTLEQSKSPSNRKKWQHNHQETFHRKHWETPATPNLLKEQVENNQEYQNYELINKNSKESYGKYDSLNTKTTFKVAGNNLVRPDSKKEYNDIAQRFEKLNNDKKEHILKILEQLELEDSINIEI